MKRPQCTRLLPVRCRRPLCTTCCEDWLAHWLSLLHQRLGTGKRMFCNFWLELPEAEQEMSSGTWNSRSNLGSSWKPLATTREMNQRTSHATPVDFWPLLMIHADLAEPGCFSWILTLQLIRVCLLLNWTAGLLTTKSGIFPQGTTAKQAHNPAFLLNFFPPLLVSAWVEALKNPK